MMWETISQQISQALGPSLGQPFAIKERRSVSGGDINQGYRIQGQNQTFFVKLNQADRLPMFEAEALGLQQLAATGTLRVPQPICQGIAQDSCYLVLEWLDLGGGSSSRELGRQLAQMHQFPGATAFGWTCDNTIGSTPQINTWMRDWAAFFGQQRIGYQFELARRNGGRFANADRLLTSIPDLLAHHPRPSLVHGDLWSGNAAVTTAGEPVIFDPAVYWADREVDLAMTELFGGFGPTFWQGYEEVWPVDPGYAQRRPLYNLYHVLNHFNLFGGSYESQSNRMIEQILRG
jgi:fructosamine-3-kinase